MKITDELFGMKQDFNRYVRFYKRKNRIGPVVGYSRHNHFARIDYLVHRTKPWQIWIHIEKEFTQTIRYETFEEAYEAMVRSARHYRLFLLY